MNQLAWLPHAAPRKDSDQWYIPEPIALSVRNVLRVIDLDPMSCSEANQIVQARKIYTIEDNGLLHTWRGRVFFNPPYSRGNIGPAVDKFVEHIESGDITEAISLTNSATDTEWFHKLAELAAAECFPGSRIKFWGPNPQTDGPRLPQTFFYFTKGTNVRRFLSEFQKVGLCRALYASIKCGGRGKSEEILGPKRARQGVA
jgi:ParB family chromosome partitioning protein